MHLTPQRMEQVISHIQTFRDYFHYHIKASKAYIHSRMRKRTADFLQGMFLLFVSMLLRNTNGKQFFAAHDQRTRSANARRRLEDLSRCRVRLEIKQAGLGLVYCGIFSVFPNIVDGTYDHENCFRRKNNNTMMGLHDLLLPVQYF